MSIVISVIESNRKFYIASDKRGERGGIKSDSYKKICQLDKDLYFGMTGIYEAGLVVLNHIRSCNLNDINSLTEKISEFFASFSGRNKPEKLTIMVAGRDNTGNFFIWQRNIQGETKLMNGSENIEYALSSNDKIEILAKYFEKQIISGSEVKDAIAKTIQYASDIDSSISKEYELYEI